MFPPEKYAKGRRDLRTLPTPSQSTMTLYRNIICLSDRGQRGSGWGTQQFSRLEFISTKTTVTLFFGRAFGFDGPNGLPSDAENCLALKVY